MNYGYYTYGNSAQSSASNYSTGAYYNPSAPGEVRLADSLVVEGDSVAYNADASAQLLRDSLKRAMEARAAAARARKEKEEAEKEKQQLQANTVGNAGNSAIDNNQQSVYAQAKNQVRNNIKSGTAASGPDNNYYKPLPGDGEIRVADSVIVDGGQVYNIENSPNYLRDSLKRAMLARAAAKRDKHIMDSILANPQLKEEDRQLNGLSGNNSGSNSKPVKPAGDYSQYKASASPSAGNERMAVPDIDFKVGFAASKLLPVKNGVKPAKKHFKSKLKSSKK
ncbi:MAG: hypothetical protein V4543_16470 [Bacteroidota bacterium]